MFGHEKANALAMSAAIILPARLPPWWWLRDAHVVVAPRRGDRYQPRRNRTPTPRGTVTATCTVPVPVGPEGTLRVKCYNAMYMSCDIAQP